jgi:hypothetical protein
MITMLRLQNNRGEATLRGGASRGAPVTCWLVSAAGYYPSVLARPCRRIRPDDASGWLQTAARTGRGQAETTGMKRKVRAGSALGRWPNPYQASVVKRADRCIAGAGGAVCGTNGEASWPSDRG